MTSSARYFVLAAFSALASLVSPVRLRAQAQPRLTVGTGEVSPRLAARVAQKLSREWNIDSARIVLSWGTGSLQGVPDSSAFKLIGGEGGWFSLLVEPPRGASAWLRFRAGVTTEQAVASRALPAGKVIGPEDMRVESRLRWGPPADSVRLAAPGWVVKRPVSGGDLLEGFRVAPPPLVSAGKPVRVLYDMGKVSVAIEGVALNDAALGQSVRVRTPGRTGVLAGTAVAPGEARMN